MSDSYARSSSSLRTGTKIAILVGVPLIVLAVYYFLAPVFFEQSGGGIFRCGSAASPNADSATTCGPPEALNRLRAIISLAIGLVVIILGFALFGVNRHDDWDDDIDLHDERRGGRDERDEEPRQAGRLREDTRRHRADGDERPARREDRWEDDEPRRRRSERSRDLDEDRPRSRRSEARDDRRGRSDDDWDLDRH